MVASPNPVTASSSVLPAFFMGGRCAIRNAMINAPMDGAARRMPNPCAPT